MTGDSSPGRFRLIAQIKRERRDYDEHGREIIPMTLGNMRQHGVRGCLRAGQRDRNLMTEHTSACPRRFGASKRTGPYGALRMSAGTSCGLCGVMDFRQGLLICSGQSIGSIEYASRFGACARLG